MLTHFVVVFIGASASTLGCGAYGVAPGCDLVPTGKSAGAFSYPLLCCSHTCFQEARFLASVLAHFFIVVPKGAPTLSVCALPHLAMVQLEISCGARNHRQQSD